MDRDKVSGRIGVSTLVIYRSHPHRAVVPAIARLLLMLTKIPEPRVFMISSTFVSVALFLHVVFIFYSLFLLFSICAALCAIFILIHHKLIQWRS